MKTFVVGYIDWFNYELILEHIKADIWQTAVIQHSKYPYKGEPNVPENPFQDPHTLALTYEDLPEEESFKQACFDCDCMMNWIEVST